MVINIEEKIFRKKMDGILRKQTRYRTPESEISEKKMKINVIFILRDRVSLCNIQNE